MSSPHPVHAPAFDPVVAALRCVRALAIALLVAWALTAVLWLPTPAWAAPARTSMDPAGPTLKAALDAYAAGQVAPLQRAQATLRQHPMRDWVRYWQVRLLPNDTDIQAFLHEQPHSYLAEQLRIDWVRGLARQGDWARLAAVADAIQEPPDAVRCWHAQARSALQQHERAHALLQPAWRQWQPLLPGCAAAARALVAVGRLPPPMLWQRARALVAMDSTDAARQVLALLPEGQRPSPAQLDAALGQPERWLGSAQALAASAPAVRPGGAALRPESQRLRELTALALVRLGSGDPDRANRVLARLARRLDASLTGQAYAQLGLLAARRLDPSAHHWFVLAVGAELTDEHRAWWARAAMRAGDWSMTRTAIAGMSAWSRSEPRWQYWQARAESALERRPQATALWLAAARDPGFYGRLAREALGPQWHSPAVAAPSRAAVSAVAREPGLVRAVALMRLGESRDAAGEWAWTLRRLDDGQRAAAAALARQQQLWGRVVDSAEQLHDGFALDLRYPTPYRGEVRAAAQRFAVNEAWVYAVMHQESRFAPQALSLKGAMGLMQVMPTTARWLAGELGWDDFDTAWLHDPARGIAMGTRYLRQLEGDLGGHLVLTAAAYNAGPGRALAWRSDRPIEGAIYAESIPIDETRDYVRRVAVAAVHYAELLQGRALTLHDLLAQVPPARGALTTEARPQPLAPRADAAVRRVAGLDRPGTWNLRTAELSGAAGAGAGAGAARLR